VEYGSRPKIGTSLAWKFLERGAAQIITVIIQIILARMVLPELFGSVSIMLVFTSFANTLIQKGFASSLVRKKEVSQQDLNTVSCGW
jgi:O-antigen/teichoic acid export membrane protein